jgi:DNA-binding beta-propeller fold protein YncE
VINAESRTVSATIKVGNSPGNMSVDPASHLLYVSAVIDTIAVGRSPTDVAIDPATRSAFVPDAGDDSVSIIGR